MSDAESKSPTIPKPKAAAKKPSGQPNTLDMVVQAITSLNERKGASVQAIKSFIMEHYPTVDPNMLKYRLKKAIEKGMNEELVVRPKGSDQTGSSLSGRFRLNKAKVEAMEKAKKPKPKTKPKAEKPKVKKPKASDKAKSPKKVTKKTEKKTTPKKAKTAKPKEKTTKAKATVEKAKKVVEKAKKMAVASTPQAKAKKPKVVKKTEKKGKTPTKKAAKK